VVIPDARKEHGMSRTTLTDAKELDVRTGGGIKVRLLWYPTTGTVAVSVHDAAQDDFFELAVEPARALEAFHHPYAFAA
jgi:hypothetical protein